MRDMIKWFLFGGFFILLLSILVVKVFATSYPQYHNYVNDFANVIDDKTELTLNNQLGSFEKRTHNQVTLVTIKSLPDQSIEEYANNLFSYWKIGHKPQDNGILILFSIKDHKDRIEVGRGLEGNLTDIQSKHILDDKVMPLMRKEDYSGGTSVAVVEVIRVLDPKSIEATTIATSSAITNSKPENVVMGLVVFLFITFVVLLILFAVFSDDGDGFGGGLVGGIIGGVIGSSLGGDSDGDSGSGFGGFGGGSSSGGGASGSW